VGAEPDGSSVDEIIIGAWPDVAFCLEEITHHTVYRHRIGGKEKAVGSLVVKSGPGSGFARIVSPAGKEPIANGQDGFAEDIRVAIDVHERIISGTTIVGAPGPVMEGMDIGNGAKVVLERKCDYSSAVGFHDRYIDEIGSVDENVGKLD